jgi:23S rRNA (adenine2503-C2)-methyltransferase
MSRALSDFDLQELSAQFEAWSLSPKHAARILRDYYRNGEVDFDGLRTGRAVRQRFERDLSLRQSRIVTRHASADGTIKLLVGFERGGAVESVLMPLSTPGRAAACVSSQIGCAMGCDFCASTRRGLERNLEAGEIVEQFLHLRAQCQSPSVTEKTRAAGTRYLRTLVFMGMGEPLQNYDNVTTAIRRIGHGDLGALGWRQITVSTVGIVPGIDRLAASGLNVNLALSLHAPDDETRSRIVPPNKRYPVAEIVAAAKRYYEKTRRITNVEYCMLAGINDSDTHAHLLAELLKGFRTHVNLIPYNTIGAGVSGVVYQRPSNERIDAFNAILKEKKVVSHLRQTRGDDVNAACGQLRETAAAS